MAQKDIDIERIKRLIDLMKDNDLVELEIAHDDDKIHLKRSSGQQPFTAIPMIGQPAGAAVPSSPAAGPVETAQQGGEADEGLVDITSPIVGTFYARPTPDSEPFVEVGSPVEPSSVVCIVEAMKVMNEIKAEVSGTIEKIMVESGQAVEYGQVLFKVKPD